jgi:FixJ family two-component response regulator
MRLACEHFATGEAFFEQFDPEAPGCIVLEMRLPGMTGLQVQQQLARLPHPPKVIVVTAHADLKTVVQAMRLRPHNFLQKQSLSETELWESIQSAIAKDCAARQQRVSHAQHEAAVRSLNKPERELLDLLLAGRSNQQIAEALGLSRYAAQSRRARLMRKLSFNTLPDLVRFAIEAGLYPADGADG